MKSFVWICVRYLNIFKPSYFGFVINGQSKHNFKKFSSKMNAPAKATIIILNCSIRSLHVRKESLELAHPLHFIDKELS